MSQSIFTSGKDPEDLIQFRGGEEVVDFLAESEEEQFTAAGGDAMHGLHEEGQAAAVDGRHPLQIDQHGPIVDLGGEFGGGRDATSGIRCVWSAGGFESSWKQLPISLGGVLAFHGAPKLMKRPGLHYWAMVGLPLNDPPRNQTEVWQGAPQRK